MTPEPTRRLLCDRTMRLYGDCDGPTIDYLRAQGKTWDQIIEFGRPSRTNADGRRHFMPVTDLATVQTTIPAEIEADALASIAQHAAAARGAYAKNTERALRADVAIFTAWCSEAGHAALPASAETIAGFIDAMAGIKAPATVRRYVSSVATFHHAAGVANPCATLAVKLALKRMHRERGRAQAQAAPVNDVLVAGMLAAAGDTLAIAATAHCSPSLINPLPPLGTGRPAPRGSADRRRRLRPITLRRSKTDQEGVGEVAPIPPTPCGICRPGSRLPVSPTGRCFAPC